MISSLTNFSHTSMFFRYFDHNFEAYALARLSYFCHIELGTIFNTVCVVLDLSNPEYSAVIIEKIDHYVIEQTNKAIIEITEAQKYQKRKYGFT